MDGFSIMMQEVAELGKQKLAEGEAQLAKFKLEPEKYATQIKFMELALNKDRSTIKALEGVL